MERKLRLKENRIILFRLLKDFEKSVTRHFWSLIDETKINICVENCFQTNGGQSKMLVVNRTLENVEALLSVNLVIKDTCLSRARDEIDIPKLRIPAW